MIYYKLWTILAHCYNAFIAYCFSFNISHFQLFRKENVIMSIKHAKFSLLYCHFWWQRFFLFMYSQFCCEIRQLWWKKFIKLIKIKKNLIKFLMKEMYIYIDICLAIQFKASNSYSLFHTEVLISWTFLGFIEPYKDVLRTSPGRIRAWCPQELATEKKSPETLIFQLPQ